MQHLTHDQVIALDREAESKGYHVWKQLANISQGHRLMLRNVPTKDIPMSGATDAELCKQIATTVNRYCPSLNRSLCSIIAEYTPSRPYLVPVAKNPTWMIDHGEGRYFSDRWQLRCGYTYGVHVIALDIGPGQRVFEDVTIQPVSVAYGSQTAHFETGVCFVEIDFTNRRFRIANSADKYPKWDTYKHYPGDSVDMDFYMFHDGHHIKLLTDKCLHVL